MIMHLIPPSLADIGKTLFGEDWREPLANSFEVTEDQIIAWLAAHAPLIALLSVGQSIDLYKDVGAPAEIAQRYREFVDLFEASRRP